MSLIDTIKESIPVGDSSVRIHDYECQECGHEFESAKTDQRAKCMECLSQNVEQFDEVERD